jgi:methyltransferase-like protein/cyclopropane fatty-acyl-phospholipid synthase-like methyltransferase
MDDKKNTTSYDETPYPNNAYCESTPENCYTIARLFKLNPPNYRKASVLELGCARGGNIIPLAHGYPDSEFVGIDLSEKQIETGQKQIDELNLTNIQLRNMSILDADRSLGEFDYIICHGVFSWVDNTVQEKILSLCNELLSANGIAYVSYNTLPGWNSLRTIRDMMKFHTREITVPKTRAQQARAVLDFVLAGSQENNSSHTDFLREEARKLADVQDNYLLHDHLEVENNPLYFYQFIETAERHNLQYLADTSLSTMFTGNLPTETAVKLRGLENLVKTEQYMDFMCDRRFRRSLLCRREQMIHRDIKTTDIQHYYLSMPLPDDAITEEQINGDAILRLSSRGINYKVEDPFSKQVIGVLLQQKRKPMHFDDLCQHLQLITGLDLEDIRERLFNKVSLIHLLFSDVINIHSDAGSDTTTVTDFPTVSGLARYQCKAGHRITNLRHQNVQLREQEQWVLVAADGSKSLSDLAKLLSDKVDSGEFKLRPHISKNARSTLEQCQLYITEMIRWLAENGLLTKK